MNKNISNLCVMIFLLFSCNNYKKAENNKEIKVAEIKTLKNGEGVDLANKRVFIDNAYRDTLKKDKIIHGIYSYIAFDTLYINSNKGVTILQYYLPNHIKNKKGISVNVNILGIKESICSNYLYISIYSGDALPYKALLVDLNKKKIIVENNRYQIYLGHSANGLYHLFEGSSSGSVGDLAVYNSNNVLLKEMHYYAINSDTNQLKWSGDEFYYYSDIDKNESTKGNTWSSKTSLIKVQKYLWKENRTIPLNEFAQAFME